MSAVARPLRMTVEEFMAWEPDDGRAWQLVDGDPQAMAPPNITHGAIQSRVAYLLGAHFEAGGNRCRAITTPGIVPRVGSHQNVRIPDIAVSCSPYADDQAILSRPLLVMEILSPSNQAETWSNVWSYTSIGSIEEIVVLRTGRIGAEVLRRNADRSWPDEPVSLATGDLALHSIGLRLKLIEIYRTTGLVGRP